MNESIGLWEILVPCNFEDTKNPVSYKHHKNWDAQVIKIAGGLTVLKPGKGYWVNESNLYHDRVIPVRIVCTEKQIDKIIKFTISHYRQLAIMAYKISSEVKITFKYDKN